MEFKELFKKVETANEINKFADIMEVSVMLNYDNYKWYKFKDYKHFIKVIKDEFIPEIIDGLGNTKFEINEEFVVTCKDWNNKEVNVSFKVEIV